MDPTGHDPVARWLAYGHPAWMLLALGLAFLALRKGLALRRARQGGERGRGKAVAAHVRVAQPAVLLVVAGALFGPVSAVWLRGWEPLRTFHGAVALVAAGLFVAAGWIGWRLHRGRSRAVDAHGWLGVLAFLMAALATVAGFVLLP